MRGGEVRFRYMEEEMSEEEILLLLRIVFPYGKLIRYKRETGYITAYYSLPFDSEGIKRRVDFLPDNIYLVEPDSRLPDGAPIENSDILHRYIQYMVAKGYSKYWLDNPYYSN